LRLASGLAEEEGRLIVKVRRSGNGSPYGSVEEVARLLPRSPSTPGADGTGAQAILDAICRRRPWIKHLFADGAYDRTKPLDKAVLDFVIEIVRRIETEPEFKVLPSTMGGWVNARSAG
jgi:hypothetical protein